MAKIVFDIEPTVIKKAENYANENHADLSLLVEQFLKDIVDGSAKPDGSVIQENKIEISDWVKSLTLSDKPIPDFDHKEQYHEYLDRKYNS